MKLSLLHFVATLILLTLVVSANAQSAKVHFSGIRSARGQIQLKVYTDDKSVQDDKPSRIVRFPKKQLRNGEMAADIQLEPGTYGFALLDDENSSGDMEYNILGVPKEGFGFS